jgi:Carboxypeptidase regulatory-like domain
MNYSVQRIIAVLISTLALSVHFDIVLGQTPVAAISGRIIDSSEAVIAGATLTVLQEQTGAVRTAESQADGSYAFANLPPGDYVIEVSKAGFSKQQCDVTLRVGDHPSVDFRLEVGPFNETIDVKVEFSGINATNSSVDGSVGRLQVETLPLNGRNFLELARIEPGVTVLSIANPGSFANNYQRVSIAGAPYLQTRVAVDGAVVTDRINGGTSQNFSQETIQEFQITSFMFDLATGTTATGAINIVSRRGSNDYHGSLFFYYRDNNMAAYPALRRNPDNPDPFFARRQSGFSLSGPFKKNRFFWFTNFERNNQDGALAVANNHPIFSKFDLVHPSPLDFDLFNVRTDANLSSKQTGFLRFSLDKNRNIASTGTGLFMPSNWQVSKTTAAQVQVGLNSVVTSNFMNDLRISYSYLNNDLGPMVQGLCKTQPDCIGVGSPQIQVFDAPMFRIGQQSSVPKTLLQRTFQIVNNLTWHRGRHTLRFGAEWERLQLHSVHSFYEQPQITLWGPTDLQRSPQLAPLFDALPASLKEPTADGPTVSDILQLPLRSFLLGIGDPTLPGRYHNDQASRPTRLRFYAQDGWNLRSNLTVNYGVAVLNRTHIFNDDLPWPEYLQPILGAGFKQPEGRDLPKIDLRVGWTWSPGKGSATVLRAGAGLFNEDLYFFNHFLERGPLGPSGNGRVIIDGAVAGLSFLSAPTDFSGQDLLTVLSGVRSNIAGRFGNGTDLAVRGVEVLKQGDRLFDPNRLLPYAIHMNAGLQRILPANVVLTADYVLRRFIHFGGFQGMAQLDRNRFNRPKVVGTDSITGEVAFVRDPVIPLCTPAQAAALDPRDQCSTGPINVYGSNANYRYEGLHLRLDKRLSSRLQLTASYAFAKNTGWVEFTEYDNFASAYGTVPGHARHRLTLSGTYRFPRYDGASRLLRGLTNIWTAAFISQTDSAPPLDTILAGVDLDGDGISRTLLPGITRHNTFGAGTSEAELRDLVAKYNAGVEAQTRYITTSRGTTMPIQPRTPFNQIITPISLSERISHGDSFITQDVRLTRRIELGESATLLLTGDVFNVFNVSNLSGYSNVLNQMNYGQPTARVGQIFGSGGPRAFQAAARLEF